MILLASNSPRRKELLALTGWEYRVISADVDEKLVAGEEPLAYVRRMAQEKSCQVIHVGKGDLLLTADTVVIDREDILGKPVSPADAVRILKRLRGHEHLVVTSLVVRQDNPQRVARDECHSKVCMREYDAEEIDAYVASGDPMDKAGAYAVQNRKFHPVTDFHGCFANVMGMPLCHLVRTLRAFGMEAGLDIPEACQRYLQYDCAISAQILSGRNLG
jgi:septum formation protein